MDYAFINEVSMLLCHDMYKKVFKWLKLLIFMMHLLVGKTLYLLEILQLPPVNGRECALLYSGTIGVYAHSSLSIFNQESAIGKALWHQITTVVTLRENMHQSIQSENDAKFCRVLENM